MFVAGQGLQAADALIQALGAAVRDENDPSSLAATLDPDLVLDLLDALPEAITHSASGVASALVNSRLVRRDEELSRARSLSSELQARLRTAPLSGPAMMGPQLSEDMQRRQVQQPALASEEWAQTCAKAMAQHVAPHSGRRQVTVSHRSRRGRQTPQHSASGQSSAAPSRPSAALRARGSARGGKSWSRSSGRGRSVPKQGN
jgi:hypothetical protein